MLFEANIIKRWCQLLYKSLSAYFLFLCLKVCISTYGYVTSITECCIVNILNTKKAWDAKRQKTGSLSASSRKFKIPGEKTPSPLWVFYLFVSLLPFLTRQFLFLILLINCYRKNNMVILRMAQSIFNLFCLFAWYKCLFSINNYSVKAP